MEPSEYERMHEIEDRMWWYRGLRQLVSDQLKTALTGSIARGPVLDAGCGTGGMLRVLGAAVLGRSTYGLEYNPTAASLASKKTGRDIFVASVNDMPVADATLGAYLSLDVMSHAGVEPARAIAEARRCLEPGAVAVFNLPAYSWMLSAHDRRVHNARRFTRSQARRLLAEQGFVVLRATYWNAFLFPLMLLHRLLEAKDAPSDVRDYPGWLDALFSAALGLERAAIRAGLSFPFGGSLIVVAARRS